MNIQIKKSKKPIKYEEAIKLMEERLLDINNNKSKELIWILQHEDLYTAGTSYDEEEINPDEPEFILPKGFKGTLT